LIKKLLSLIHSEDKKNPFTDEELARKLGVGREKVNELRLSSNIPNYLARREAGLLAAIERILDENDNISSRKIVMELNKLGFQLSSFGLNKYKEQICRMKVTSSPPKRRNPQINKKEDEGFSRIVGNNGSLSQTTKLAKAAVLYPKFGLHTLIVGSTGVGKSQLVEEMHYFAKMVRNNKNIPLIIFNCADYGDNPQLLVAQLFGYSKGSFTGADSDKAGLVERANGGMLFLDEIHRLPSKGQEILFRIMDKGEFSRLGETDRIRKVQVMIIGATTENIESSLLNTFRRRVPVMIQIPSLEERPNVERLKLIKIFLVSEASRINKMIQVPKEIVKLLLLYKCSGNIGQLKSDIQVICAKAFLNYISGKTAVMKITMNDLLSHIKNHLPDVIAQRAELDIMNISDMIIDPDSDADALTANKKMLADHEISEYNIYQFIERRMDELQGAGQSSLEARKNIADELEEKVKAETTSIENKYAGISDRLLQDIVGEEIIGIVEDIKRILIAEIGIRDFSIIKILYLHIGAAVERLRMGKSIINPRLEDIRQQYKKEFRIALKITQVIKMKLGLEFPEDEAGFIALYLNHFFMKKAGGVSSKVGLLVITHGEVARAMLDIAQAIVGIRHGVAITMRIDEQPEEVFTRVREAAKAVNQGSGVLLLVDMGSLITFGELITEELGIPTRVLARVDTLIVMEAIRKSVFPAATLYTVYDSLWELGNLLPGLFIKNQLPTQMNCKKVIITTCFTGKGTALQIKRIVEEKLRLLNSKIDVVSLGLMDSETDMMEEISKLQQANREIVLITGIINPKCNNIPFLPFEEILNGEKLETLIATMKLRDELSNETDEKSSHVSSAPEWEAVFDERLVRVFHSLTSKEEVISIMAKAMVKERYVQDGFYDDVMEREDWGSSYIGNAVAIPHANKRRNIIKPGIGIAVLKNSLAWEEDEVSIVFMLALTTEHKDIFLNFYNVIKETDMVEKIKSLLDSKLIVTEVLHHVRTSTARV
jgi:transcriptional regulator with AAA-type ATPase domain/transcriptional regulatory protein LevR